MSVTFAQEEEYGQPKRRVKHYSRLGQDCALANLGREVHHARPYLLRRTHSRQARVRRVYPRVPRLPLHGHHRRRCHAQTQAPNTASAGEVMVIRCWRSVCGWCYLHSPLVIMAFLAVFTTAISLLWQDQPWWLSWAPGMSNEFIAFTIVMALGNWTPPWVREKEEQSVQ
jgi:hypothetical protein